MCLTDTGRCGRTIPIFVIFAWASWLRAVTCEMPKLVAIEATYIRQPRHVPTFIGVIGLLLSAGLCKRHSVMNWDVVVADRILFPMLDDSEGLLECRRVVVLSIEMLVAFFSKVCTVTGVQSAQE